MRQHPSRLTLNSALAHYREDCAARGQSPRTLEGKVSMLNGFIRWCAGQGLACPARVKPAHLEQYRRYLYQYRQPFNGKPLDIATQRNHLTAVVMFFRRLKRDGLIGVDPAAEFELPRVPRRLPRAYLLVSEIEALCRQTLLHGATGTRDRAILETYYATGIRRMELAHLRIADVTFAEGVLVIRSGKGGNDRRVPIAERALHWIKQYLTEVRPTLAQLDAGEVLFLDHRGKPFRAHQLTRLASKYVRRAGITKPGACNLFRHSTATLMLDNGADLRHVQEMMGHASTSTTQIYTHVSRAKLKEVYRRTHPAAAGKNDPLEA
jgi:integrase/recombinase XerD